MSQANQHPSHTEEEIRTFLQRADVAVIATAAGEDIRLRMMHLGFEDDFTIYLATLHNDPKVMQLTHHPAVAVLVSRVPADVTEAEEVEYTGKAVLIHDRAERERCLASTARTSPIVQALAAQGNTGVLDCLKIVPQLIKYRKFREIVMGQPPTVLEFAGHRRVVSDWVQLGLALRSWWVGVRPNSLVAALVPVLLGTVVAWWHTHNWQFPAFILTLLAALMLQAGTNLLNDYHDHYSGNDTGNRAFIRPFGGGSRVIQLGLLSPLAVLTGGMVLCLTALAIGGYFTLNGRPLVLPLALLGTAIGVVYNRSGWNLIQAGLGEVAVGLNFGLLMTLGTYYIQVGRLDRAPLLASLPVALLIMAVLFINGFQDAEGDRRSGKRTTVVRLGRRRAARVMPFFFTLAYAVPVALVVAGAAPAGVLLTLLTTPLAYRALVLCLRHCENNIDLAPANGLTALTHLSFGLFLALGYLSSAGPAYTAAFGLLFVAFTLYMYRYTERLRLASIGVQKAMAG